LLSDTGPGALNITVALPPGPAPELPPFARTLLLEIVIPLLPALNVTVASPPGPPVARTRLDPSESVSDIPPPAVNVTL
jgi:hypothetical protein